MFCRNHTQSFFGNEITFPLTLSLNVFNRAREMKITDSFERLSERMCATLSTKLLNEKAFIAQ